MKVERRLDLERIEMDCIWLEVFPQNSKSFLVGNL